MRKSVKCVLNFNFTRLTGTRGIQILRTYTNWISFLSKRQSLTRGRKSDKSRQASYFGQYPIYLSFQIFPYYSGADNDVRVEIFSFVCTHNILKLSKILLKYSLRCLLPISNNFDSTTSECATRIWKSRWQIKVILDEHTYLFLILLVQHFLLLSLIMAFL